MISHNLADVFEVADRIVVLRLGRRRRPSSPPRSATRRSSPRSPAVRASPARPPGTATRHRRRSRHEHRRARPAPRHRRRGALRPLDPLHPARAPGGARLPAGHRRPRHHLGLLPVSEENFLTAGNITNLIAPDHGARDHRHGRRAGAAAGRDRPLGRHRQRPRRRGHGRAEREERLAGLGGHPRRPPRRRGRRRGAGLLHHLLPRALVRRHAGRPAGLPGAAALRARRHRDAEPHRQHDHRPVEHPLLDYVGWIIAVVLLVPYVLLTLAGYRRRMVARSTARSSNASSASRTAGERRRSTACSASAAAAPAPSRPSFRLRAHAARSLAAVLHRTRPSPLRTSTSASPGRRADRPGGRLRRCGRGSRSRPCGT